MAAYQPRREKRQEFREDLPMASLTIAAVSPYPSIVSVMGQSLSSTFALFGGRYCLGKPRGLAL